MGKPLKDETGNQYGEWLVIERAPSNAHPGARWRVRCTCGTESVVFGTSLRFGSSTRCSRCNQTGANSVTHGLSKTREYSIWCGIIGRTENPRNSAYKNYGGRGIKMSKEWRNSFERFFEDMGKCPEGLSLERKDNDGPYSKDNCEWASRRVQSRNTRQNVIIAFEGESMCMADWSDKLGIPYSTIADRVRRYGVENPSKILHKGSLK